MNTINVSPITPRIGAEITGVDLREELSEAAIHEIRAAWLDHQVVFFRDQDLTHEQHIAFARQFGEPHIHPTVSHHPNHPEILVIHADENSKNVAGDGWHTDVSFEQSPPTASVLRMTEVPPDGGGATLFSSMYAAYEALSPTFQEFLEQRVALHQLGKLPGHRQEATPPSALHPVVSTHPETGRKALYVNQGFTKHIEGLTREESRSVLQHLYRHVENPNFHARFHWSKNSIAMWDNRCVQHYATWDYFPATRRGYRVTLSGASSV